MKKVYQTEVFKASYPEDLEALVNDSLSRLYQNRLQFVDIKYSTTISKSGDLWSAMIIYNIPPNSEEIAMKTRKVEQLMSHLENELMNNSKKIILKISEIIKNYLTK